MQSSKICMLVSASFSPHHIQIPSGQATQIPMRTSMLQSSCSFKVLNNAGGGLVVTLFSLFPLEEPKAQPRPVHMVLCRPG